MLKSSWQWFKHTQVFLIIFPSSFVFLPNPVAVGFKFSGRHGFRPFGGTEVEWNGIHHDLLHRQSRPWWPWRPAMGHRLADVLLFLKLALMGYQLSLMVIQKNNLSSFCYGFDGLSVIIDGYPEKQLIKFFVWLWWVISYHWWLSRKTTYQVFLMALMGYQLSLMVIQKNNLSSFSYGFDGLSVIIDGYPEKQLIKFFVWLWWVISYHWWLSRKTTYQVFLMALMGYQLSLMVIQKNNLSSFSYGFDGLSVIIDGYPEKQLIKFFLWLWWVISYHWWLSRKTTYQVFRMALMGYQLSLMVIQKNNLSSFCYDFDGLSVIIDGYPEKQLIKFFLWLWWVISYHWWLSRKTTYQVFLMALMGYQLSLMVIQKNNLSSFSYGFDGLSVIIDGYPEKQLIKFFLWLWWVISYHWWLSRKTTYQVFLMALMGYQLSLMVIQKNNLSSFSYGFDGLSVIIDGYPEKQLIKFFVWLWWVISYHWWLSRKTTYQVFVMALMGYQLSLMVIQKNNLSSFCYGFDGLSVIIDGYPEKQLIKFLLWLWWVISYHWWLSRKTIYQVFVMALMGYQLSLMVIQKNNLSSFCYGFDGLSVIIDGYPEKQLIKFLLWLWWVISYHWWLSRKTTYQVFVMALMGYQLSLMVIQKNNLSSFCYGFDGLSVIIDGYPEKQLIKFFVWLWWVISYHWWLSRKTTYQVFVMALMGYQLSLMVIQKNNLSSFSYGFDGLSVIIDGYPEKQLIKFFLWLWWVISYHWWLSRKTTYQVFVMALMGYQLSLMVIQKKQLIKFLLWLWWVISYHWWLSRKKQLIKFFVWLWWVISYHWWLSRKTTYQVFVMALMGYQLSLMVIQKNNLSSFCYGFDGLPVIIDGYPEKQLIKFFLWLWWVISYHWWLSRKTTYQVFVMALMGYQLSLMVIQKNNLSSFCYGFDGLSVIIDGYPEKQLIKFFLWLWWVISYHWWLSRKTTYQVFVMALMGYQLSLMVIQKNNLSSFSYGFDGLSVIIDGYPEKQLIKFLLWLWWVISYHWWLSRKTTYQVFVMALMGYQLSLMVIQKNNLSRARQLGSMNVFDRKSQKPPKVPKDFARSWLATGTAFFRASQQHPTAACIQFLLHMGVSENSVPLNPIVNDHYPYYINGYFIGNIPNIFRQTHIEVGGVPLCSIHIHRFCCALTDRTFKRPWQELQVRRRQHRSANSWRRWWRAAVLPWPPCLGSEFVKSKSHEISCWTAWKIAGSYRCPSIAWEVLINHHIWPCLTIFVGLVFHIYIKNRADKGGSPLGPCRNGTSMNHLNLIHRCMFQLMLSLYMYNHVHETKQATGYGGFPRWRNILSYHLVI